MADRNLIAFYTHPDYHAVGNPALHCSLTEARAAAAALTGSGIAVQGVCALARNGDLAPEGLLKNWGVDDTEQLCLVVVTLDGHQIKPRLLREELERIKQQGEEQAEQVEQEQLTVPPVPPVPPTEPSQPPTEPPSTASATGKKGKG